MQSPRRLQENKLAVFFNPETALSSTADSVLRRDRGLGLSNGFAQAHVIEQCWELTKSFVYVM
jgi:hypothetical protein